MVRLYTPPRHDTTDADKKREFLKRMRRVIWYVSDIHILENAYFGDVGLNRESPRIVQHDTI